MSTLDRISRREFLVVTAGLVAGCKSMDELPPGGGGELVINAGPAAQYTANGILRDWQKLSNDVNYQDMDWNRPGRENPAASQKRGAL